MMRLRGYDIVAILTVFGLTACTPGSPGAAGGGANAEAPREQRLAIVATNSEPTSLSIRQVGSTSAFAGQSFLKRFANAELTVLDGNLVFQPYLAEARPQLNTDSWKVFPDGRMETTWKLRAGAAWQDGTPLTTHDYVFAKEIYSHPQLDPGGSPFQRAIGDVQVVDDRTMVYRYQRPYVPAAELTNELPALPRHILERPFREMDPAAFSNLPYWTREYVGLGPYKIDRWEPGAYLEGVAFDQHILGRPKMDRLRVVFISDTRTGLANVLSGSVDFATDNSIGIEEALILKKEWVAKGDGAITFVGPNWRAIGFQLRPDLVQPRALLDKRVRQAIAFSVDKETMNDIMYEGLMETGHFVTMAKSIWGPVVEDSIIKYPFDPRRTDQLMNEAGFRKGTDGFYAGADGRFVPELWTSGSDQNNKQMSIVASTLRQVGIEVTEYSQPRAQAQDPEARVTFPGMYIYSSGQGPSVLNGYTSSQIPSAASNWRGGANRGGWSNTEFDRLHAQFTASLDPREAGNHLRQMARIWTDELPLHTLVFALQPEATVKGFHGPALPVGAEGSSNWNLHEWEFR